MFVIRQCLTKIDKTFQSLTEDVNRQTEREKQLQKRYAELQAELEDIHKGRLNKEGQTKQVEPELS